MAASNTPMPPELASRFPVLIVGAHPEEDSAVGRSVEEIGQRLGLGHTAAQSLLARARIAFREALETVFGSTARDILAGMRGK